MILLIAFITNPFWNKAKIVSWHGFTLIQIIMRTFNILYFDGYDEVRDADTHEVVFSTRLPDDLPELVSRWTMKESVIENIVNIWNKTGKATDNLWSGGSLDDYLLDEGDCTTDEMEIIVESLYRHSNI